MVKVLDFHRGGVIQLSSVNEEHKPITVDDQEIDRLHFVAAIVKSSRYYRTLSYSDRIAAVQASSRTIRSGRPPRLYAIAFSIFVPKLPCFHSSLPRSPTTR